MVSVGLPIPGPVSPPPPVQTFWRLALPACWVGMVSVAGMGRGGAGASSDAGRWLPGHSAVTTAPPWAVTGMGGTDVLGLPFTLRVEVRSPTVLRRQAEMLSTL